MAPSRWAPTFARLQELSVEQEEEETEWLKDGTCYVLTSLLRSTVGRSRQGAGVKPGPGVVCVRTSPPRRRITSSTSWHLSKSQSWPTTNTSQCWTRNVAWSAGQMMCKQICTSAYHTHKMYCKLYVCLMIMHWDTLTYTPVLVCAYTPWIGWLVESRCS